MTVEKAQVRREKAKADYERAEEDCKKLWEVYMEAKAAYGSPDLVAAEAAAWAEAVKAAVALDKAKAAWLVAEAEKKVEEARR